MSRDALQVRVALKVGMTFPGIPELAYQAGLAMEWLTELCCTPLFYHRCVRDALHAASRCMLLMQLRAVHGITVLKDAIYLLFGVSEKAFLQASA